MEKQDLFKWKYHQSELALLTGGWYQRYNLSFLMEE